MSNGFDNHFICKGGSVVINNDYSTEEKLGSDQEDDNYYEDYDSILLKRARWQRLFGWAIILFALSNLAFVLYSILIILPDTAYRIDAILMVTWNIAITAFNIFLITVGIQKIKKNSKKPFKH